MSNTVSWKSRFESGEVLRAVECSTNLSGVASDLGCTVPALRRAWDRHGPDYPISDHALKNTPVGSDISADALDEMVGIKLPGEKYAVSGPESTHYLEPFPGQRVLIPGDIHFGIEDSHALGLMRSVATDFGVHHVIYQGDTFDCYGISRHNKSASRINAGELRLSEERENSRSLMKWTANLTQSSGVQSLMLPGNHEDRLLAVTDLNPALEGALTIKRIFDIPDEITVLPHFSRIRAGSLVIEHGHKLPGSLSQYGPKRVLTRFPDQTTVYGHTHRIAEWSHTTYDRDEKPRTRKAITIGHLSDWRSHGSYAPRPNWQQGFLLIEFWTSSGGDLRYTLYPVEIHNGECQFMGKTYR
jgi:hypothetical protein